MIVEVVEQYKRSTREIEGYEYDRRKFELDSPEFLKYLDRFHIKEKYLKGKTCRTDQMLNHDNKIIGRADYYFHGWVQIIMGNARVANQLCYIVIEYPT